MFRLFTRCLLGVIAMASLCAFAAEPARNVAVAAAAERKVALVIGNGKYPGASLRNPGNDAKDMAAALRGLGFEVIEKIDVTQKEMNRAITQFGGKLGGDAVALFFYAGHGIQVKGKNYLIPIDAQIENEASVRAEAVDVDAILDQLGASPLNVVILDACRNNPFERRFRSMGGGLAQMDAPKGTLIAYSTSPGRVASDGDGRNGLYTQELLKVIQAPGLEVEKAFKRVRANVARLTGDNQIPWEASSLTGDFFFSRGRPATAGEAAAPRLQSEAEVEQEFWDSVKGSNRAEALQGYLRQYPQGRFAALAAAKVDALGDGRQKENVVPPVRAIRLAVEDNLDRQSIYPHPVCSYPRPVAALVEAAIRGRGQSQAPDLSFAWDAGGDAELLVRPVKMSLAKAAGADSDFVNTLTGVVQVRLMRDGKSVFAKTLEARSTASYSFGFSCSAWDEGIDKELKKVIDELAGRLVDEVLKAIASSGPRAAVP